MLMDRRWVRDAISELQIWVYVLGVRECPWRGCVRVVTPEMSLDVLSWDRDSGETIKLES